MVVAGKQNSGAFLLHPCRCVERNIRIALQKTE
jgi:hypothetical protein